MDIRIQEQAQSGQAPDGGIALEVLLAPEDVEQLRDDARRALGIERALPANVRTPLADVDDAAYTHDFVETRAVNDTLAAYSIIPVAKPHVTASDVIEGMPHTFHVSVYPRPEAHLTSIDPVDLGTKRVVKPGFSAKAGSEGDGNVEFLDDEKTLRIAMLDRLVMNMPEGAMRALGAEYQENYELQMMARGIDPATYREAQGLDEEQYTIMMTRQALGDARWNYALDAVFAGVGLQVTEDDLLTAFELQAPGQGAQLLELHELRNDLYLTVEKLRRGKALKWLRENALE